jgi:hypothetical protein
MGYGSTSFNLQSPTASTHARPPGAPRGSSAPRCSEAQVEEGYSLHIGRRVRHSAFSLADTYSSQSEEEEVWVSRVTTTCGALPRPPRRSSTFYERRRVAVQVEIEIESKL